MLFLPNQKVLFQFFDDNLRDYLAEENLKNEIPSIKVSKIAHLDITSNGEALGTIDIGLFGDQARLNKLFDAVIFIFFIETNIS